jgi:hypothetical protein
MNAPVRKIRLGAAALVIGLAAPSAMVVAAAGGAQAAPAAKTAVVKSTTGSAHAPMLCRKDCI